MVGSKNKSNSSFNINSSQPTNIENHYNQQNSYQNNYAKRFSHNQANYYQNNPGISYFDSIYFIVVTMSTVHFYFLPLHTNLNTHAKSILYLYFYPSSIEIIGRLRRCLLPYNSWQNNNYSISFLWHCEYSIDF